MSQSFALFCLTINPYLTRRDLPPDVVCLIIQADESPGPH